MSFAGIIETVLVGLLIALATNNDAREFVTSSSNFLLLITFVGTGFLCYIFTAIFALLAFWETTWIRTPQLPSPSRSQPSHHTNSNLERQLEDALSVLETYFSDPSKIELELYAGQIAEANLVHMETNRMKFNLLNVASIFLVLGIGATAVGGFVMLFMVK